MRVKVKLNKRKTECLEHTYYEVDIRIKTSLSWKKLNGPKETVQHLLKRNYSKEVNVNYLLYSTNIMSKLKHEINNENEIVLTNEDTLYRGSWVLYSRKKGDCYRGEECLTDNINDFSEEQLERIVIKLFRKFIACILGNIPVWSTNKDRNDYINGNVKHMICE